MGTMIGIGFSPCLQSFAGGAWSPVTVNPYAWYDAADAGSLTLNGSSVEGWDDISGNDNHLAEMTNPPAYDEINTRITFDGVAQILRVNSSVIYQPDGSDTYIVLSGPSQLENTIVADGNTALANAEWMYRTGISPRPERISVRIRDDGGAVSAANISSGTAFDDTENQVYYSDNDSPAVGMFGRTNGQNFSGFGWTRKTPTLNAFSVGAAIRNGVEDNHAEINIHEIIICRNLDTDERQLMEGYLAWKWIGGLS